MFGPSRRVLAISAHGCECYLVSGSRLALEARFTAAQADEYAVYVGSRRGSVVTVLADLLEEDFRQDTLPFLRGRSRAQLIARRAAQTYRDTPFHTSASLGREKEGRRDERLQWMALTNAEALNAWLTPLAQAHVRVGALVSPPLVAPALLRQLGRRIGSRPARMLVVTLNRSGLRQTLIEGDTARFSRLAAIGGDDDPASAQFATECLAEVSKTQQYLVGLRLLPRDARIPVLLVVPPGGMDNWSRPGLLVDAIEPVFIDLDEARRATGVRMARTGTEAVAPQFADTLWVLATQGLRPVGNFAPPWLSEAYRQWQGRIALWLAGAAVMVAGVAYGVERWVAALDLEARAREQSAQAVRDLANHDRIRRGFPPLPATPEQLRAGVTAFETLAGRATNPGSLMGEAGRVLATAPDFRLGRLDWQLAETESPEGPVVGNAAAPAPPPPADGKAAPLFEVLTLHGNVGPGPVGGDPRRDNEAASRTAEALKAIRGASVTLSRVPINISPDGSITGEGDGRPRGAEVNGVVIRVARKVGP